MRLVTSGAWDGSRVSSMTWGSVALPRMTVSFTLLPGAPRSGRMPSNTDMFARRRVVDRADVVARAEAGLGRRRSVARRDDAQVVLPREIEADVAGRQRGARLDLLHLVGAQKRAVGIEAVGQAGHGAQHDLVAVDLLDVLVGDQLDDFLVDLEMLVRVLAGGRLAEEPAERPRRR